MSPETYRICLQQCKTPEVRIDTPARYESKFRKSYLYEEDIDAILNFLTPWPAGLHILPLLDRAAPAPTS